MGPLLRHEPGSLMRFKWNKKMLIEVVLFSLISKLALYSYVSECLNVQELLEVNDFFGRIAKLFEIHS